MRIFIFSSLLLLHWSQLSTWAEAEKNFRLTNLKCETLDKPFTEFSVCRLAVPSRNTIVLNLHAVLHQVPITNITINIALLKKASRYRTYLYDFTVDFCQYMSNRDRNPFIKVFIERILTDSNINHTCPYNHDIIVRNMVLTDELFKLFPLPAGEYKFHLKVGVFNDWKADVQLFFTYS